jgi:2-polyprenyl-3-methyl-5-hydroxy-6-metoxy-1,4-benzoquinol methylase
MYGLKTLLKDWTPPAIWRLAQNLAHNQAVNPLRQGEERGSDFYDQSFRANDHWRQHYTRSPYYPLWLVVADRMLRSNAGSVLDIGCGPGQVAMLLRDKGFSKYLGIDFSRERIQQAKKVCPELEFVVADIFQSDLLRTHQYDTVICLEFLEHVERDLEVIEQIQPGSRFFGSVPNFPSAGHVRHFADADQTAKRYGPSFDTFRVDAIWGNPDGTIKRFLMEGIKK